MRVEFKVVPHILKFRFEAGTSRGSFTEKETWFIQVWQKSQPSVSGWGEASPLKGLSIDYSELYSRQLNLILQNLSTLSFPDTADELIDFITENIPNSFPSIRFGVETALLDLLNGGQKMIFDTPFYRGNQRIPINGLIWMGERGFMEQQIEEKLRQGFSTIKLKIGALDFDTELDLLEDIRSQYSDKEITLRVDANGAFSAEEAMEKLEQLASLAIHSIEQPIKQGQVESMTHLCAESPLPIALDEELIGIHTKAEKLGLLQKIKPAYIILKPSLLGGIMACKEWIEVAESLRIGWWMTSMLESNIGLNAIAQFTAIYNTRLPQGLGTGQLYHNNIGSPLEIRKGELLYNSPGGWQSPLLSLT